MPLLTISTPPQRTSFAFPCEFTFHESLYDRRREVATCSFITTSGALRCNFLKLNKEVRSRVTRVSNEESSGKTAAVECLSDEESFDLGVRAALSMLKFYKREISPLLPLSCRYVPTCSVYSMEAYKRYGVVKGTILTAWRLCRCNPLVKDYKLKWEHLEQKTPKCWSGDPAHEVENRRLTCILRPGENRDAGNLVLGPVI